MTGCPDCDLTVERGGMWHGYRAACHECSARAIARSLAAFHAVRHRDATELREAIARILPEHSYEDARAMVWRWRLVDHPPIEADTQETPAT